METQFECFSNLAKKADYLLATVPYLCMPEKESVIVINKKSYKVNHYFLDLDDNVCIVILEIM